MAEDPTENYITGWIKLYRSIENKGWYRDSEYVHLWVHLLIKASHREKEFLMNGEVIRLKSGQFITGRKALSLETGIKEWKIETILKCFEKDNQIQQQTNSRNRLISITYWDDYQKFQQQTDSKPTADQQQTDTINNLRIKELKEGDSKSEPSATDAPAEIEKTTEKVEYSGIEKTGKAITDYILNKKPKHYQPYVDLWNIFAEKYSCTKVESMSDKRKAWLRSRLLDKDFDFVAILKKLPSQKFCIENGKGGWFGFEFIIRNDNNYRNILEGKYSGAGKNDFANNQDNSSLQKPQT